MLREKFEDARNNIDNQKIIKKVCSKYSHILSEDMLIQCGDCALWECLQKHDDKLQKFTSSLYNYVRWNCLRAIYELRTHYELQDVGDICCNSSSLDDYVTSLSPIEAHIIKLRYEQKYTLREIAQQLGYSIEGIRQKITVCLNKIREDL